MRRSSQLKKRIEIAKDCVYNLRLLEMEMEGEPQDQAELDTVGMALVNVRGMLSKWDKELDRLAERPG